MKENFDGEDDPDSDIAEMATKTGIAKKQVKDF